MTFYKPGNVEIFSTLSTPSTVLIVVCAIIAVSLLRNKFRSGLRNIPGPTLAAYTALWRWHDVRKGQAHQTAISLHRKYGSLVRIGPNHVSVSDPQEIKKIYGLKSGYTKTGFYPIQSITWKGKPEVNLFGTRDEAYHREMKKPIANAFSLTTLLTNEPAVDSCTNLLIEKLVKFSDAKNPIDLGEWVQFYTFDVVGELTFAKKLGFLETGGDVDGMIETIEGILVYASQIGQIPVWHNFLLGNPLLPYLIPSMENWNQVLTFTLKAVNSVLGIDGDTGGSLKKGGELDVEALDQRGDMLSKWYSVKLATPERMSTRDIVVHLSTNVFAGSDTTAIAIRAVLYHLLKNPDKMQKVVREIDTAAAEGKLSQPISFKESTNHLPYMQAAIKEGIRIHPSVGLLLERHVPRGGSVICGKHIAEGTIVGINAWVTQHDQDVFPNPDAFRPERWMDASEEELKIMEQSFFAFGAGTRTCIGRHIAVMEMAKIIPELLRTFEISLADPGAEWKTKNIWFVQQEGLICNLKRRVKS
ncbi:cytochrome P450 [Ilyonectria destructans]|nr:cytochrome P450 [Ilyonectria destructans]